MRAGRGDGWVVKPVRPVGVLGSRNFLADFTVANKREVGRMLDSLAGSAVLVQGKGLCKLVLCTGRRRFFDVGENGANTAKKYGGANLR